MIGILDSSNNDLLISIIIPTFNSHNTLERCLKSIVEQDYNNFEIWLIDAVSTDGTLLILEKYKEQYSFIHFITEHDKGIYDAMNKGVNLCAGEWIYFLGSDDTLYDNNVLSSVINKIKTCDDKVIYGNVIMRGQNQWNLDGVVFAGEYNLERILNMTICHQALFYSKIVFEKYGNFDLKYNVDSDYDFNLRCYANTSFSYLDIIVANFFVGGHSTNTKELAFHKNRGAILLKYFKTRIYQKPFMNSRLYLRRAALSLNSPLNIGGRLFCLFAYIKLKIQSLIYN